MKIRWLLFGWTITICSATFGDNLQSFLVTWDPATLSNREAFDKHLGEQADSLLKLWRDEVVENVYLNPAAEPNIKADIPTVAFVIRAKSKAKAHHILKDMPYVQHKVIDYTLSPVGSFWLGKYDPSIFNKPAEEQDTVTLINAFEVPTGKEQAAIRHWEKARDFLIKQPGYISTKLHRSKQPNTRFYLINVAQWTSEEAFNQAIKRMNEELKPAGNIEGMQFYPGLYDVIRG